METIIVTGSSGFIGTKLVLDLVEKFRVIGIDVKSASIKHEKYTHYQMDLTNKENLNNVPVIGIKCVCHLAAKIRVDESMSEPKLYYLHNVIGTTNLLDWCVQRDIKNFIFASTAAVYGDIKRESSTNNCGFFEVESGNPKSVYGQNKLECENILHDYSTKFGLRGYIFRFFNVCGGSEKNHDSPVHLLPIIVDNLIKNKDVYIYGNDYNTRDGTCLRDYIHLRDISLGFMSGIDHGFTHDNFKIYNLGSGSGYTVNDIVFITVNKYIATVGHTESKIVLGKRRPGDVDILLANCDKAKKELGWTPTCDIETMISDTIKSFNE